MLAGDPFDLAQFTPTIAMIVGNAHVGIQPEFRGQVTAVNMHVTRFATIIGVEIESMRSDTQCRWHGSSDSSICTYSSIAQWLADLNPIRRSEQAGIRPVQHIHHTTGCATARTPR